MRIAALLMATVAHVLSAQDFTWMNGQSRQREFPLSSLSKHVALSLYLDSYFAYSTHRPSDHTLTGGASVGRHGEFQLNLASVGAEWSYRSMIGRLSLQAGSMLNRVQDLDGSGTRGRNLSTASLHNIREATVGYHWDTGAGVNLEAGIFMSYIGLESYLLAENWNYSRSLVCEFTPFYFQGVRLQVFPSARLKIEPWVMNGWQTYGASNDVPAVGLSVNYRPREALGFVGNFYYGSDTRDDPGRKRLHSDHSALLRYYNAPGASGISKAALSVNNHIGVEQGGLSSSRGKFLGTAVANRVWLNGDKLAFTLRGELVDNPGRYLAIAPRPTGFPDAGTGIHLGGVTATVDVMPTDLLAWRFEYLNRRASVPYFAGRSGLASSQHLLTGAVNFRM